MAWMLRWDEVGPEPHAAPAGPGGGATILVVDDDPGWRSALRRLLRREGYRVLEACDGREALLLLDANPRVALVVSDVVMPGIDGLALCVRLAERGCDVPVLLVSSGFEGALPLAEALAVPFDFLEKSFEPAALRRKVREMIAPRARESLAV